MLSVIEANYRVSVQVSPDNLAAIIRMNDIGHDGIDFA